MPIHLANIHTLIPFVTIHILFNHAHHAVYDHAYPVPLGNMISMIVNGMISMIKQQKSRMLLYAYSCSPCEHPYPDPFCDQHILFNHAHHAVYDHAYPVPLGNMPILFP